MLKLLALLLMTFILVSCGGGKSTATLSISRGMVLGNTAFSGGIYITGEKTDGSERFHAAITSGNTTSVSIGFGNWNFKVIGWDGAGVMQGTAYCKYLANYPFTTEGQALEINTTTAECFDGTNISGTNQHVTPNSPPFRSLVVNSCGALFNPSFTNTTTALGYFDYCTQGNYGTEYKATQQNYFKLHLVNQTIGGIRTAGITSSCLTAKQGGQNVLFPNRMPVTIKFYKDSSCTQEVDEYRFKNGLDASVGPSRALSDFDWAVTADSVSFFVNLASGASKRGTTAFHTEVPVFKCMDAGILVPCPKFPSTTSGIYYLDPDSPAVIKIPNALCDTVTPTGFTITKYACHNFNGSAYVTLKVNSTTAVNGSISMGGGTYTVKVGNTSVGYQDDRVRDTYKTLKRTLGFRNQTNLNNSLADDYDEEENDEVGILGSAIYDIGSMGAGGTFYDYYNQCSTGGLAQISRGYVKNGINYTVHLSGISGNTPAFTSETEDPGNLMVQSRLNRRIIVRKLQGGSYVTEKVIEISCDTIDTNSASYIPMDPQVRNGRMEEQRTWEANGNTVSLKKIIYWNTASSDTARFDVYRKKSYYIGSTPQKVERNFYRVTKAKTDNYNHYRIHGMTYQTLRDGSAFDESIMVSEVDAKDISLVPSYSHKRVMDFKIENTSVGTIFGDVFANEMRKVKFGYNAASYDQEQSRISTSNNKFIQARRLNSQLKIRYTNGSVITTQTETYDPDNIATDISPDGTQMIVAASYMNTVYYYVYNNGVLATGTALATNAMTDVKVAIRNDGTWVVGYIESVSELLRWKKSDGTTFPSPYSSYDHKKLDIVKDSSEFYLSFIRTDGVMGQYAEVCKASNNACNGYASRVAATEFTFASLVPVSGGLYASYIHSGIIYSTLINTSTLYGGTQNTLTDYKFSPYEHTFYSNVSPDSILRTAAGTAIEVDYAYYSPSIPTFEMKPSNLYSTTFDALFSGTFSTQTN